MDFLRNCTTNHYSVKEISALQYAIYEHDQHHEQINDLRSKHILYCQHDGRLYIFSHTAIEETIPKQAGGWNLQEQGSMQTWLKSDRDTAGMRLKDAIEEGLSYNLAEYKVFKKLGRWTWILASGSGHDDSMVLQVQTTISDVDTLIFAFEIETVPLRVASCHTHQMAGSNVLLSPSGIQGSIVADDNQALDLSSQDEWKKAVLAELRGESAQEKVEWLRVCVQPLLGERYVIAWPRERCFVVRRSTDSNNRWSWSLGGNNHNALPEPDFTDGLAFAYSWLRSASERQQPDNAGRNVNLVATTETRSELDDAEPVASPVFVARLDMTQHTVYPTPPDGMVGITYTQPALPVETPVDTMMQAETAENEANAVDDIAISAIDAEHSMPTLARETSMLSNPAKFQRSMTDELFGDAETGIVGDEIGDDDFDFFDTGEVEDHNSSADVDMPVLDESQVLDDSSARAIITDRADEKVSTDQPAHHENSLQTHEQANTTASKTLPETPATLNHFDIMERLLPAPVPASTTREQPTQHGRRESHFGLVQFNNTPYPSSRLAAESALSTRHKSRLPFETRAPGNQQHTHDSDADSSASSNADNTFSPPALPWSNKKRKRATSGDAKLTAWNSLDTARHCRDSSTDRILGKMLVPHVLNLDNVTARQESLIDTISLEQLIGNSSRDLITIAQLVAEQSMSCITILGTVLSSIHTVSAIRPFAKNTQEHILLPSLSSLLPSLQEDDVSSLAVQREMAQRPAKPTNRPQRPEISPDLYQLQAPFLRFRRADSLVEMLPPAIQFWDTLSLAPAHGSKKVCSFFVAPDNEVLHQRLADFRSDLKTTYETSRLGMFDGTGDTGDDRLRVWSAYVERSDYAAISVYEAYKDACLRLAQRLTEQATKDPETSFAVFMVDPFPADVARHILCACFWTLYRSYLDANKAASHERVSDLCLHILPSSLASSPDALTMLTSEQLNFIAREVYDRCPPPDACNSKSSISASNSVLLAEALPKRINFQLVANPPSDLIHEGSELHLSYAKSQDGMWISVVWSDSVGNQENASFCLRGFSMNDLISEIWNRTVRILQSRQGFWRVSIATLAFDEIETARWREVVNTHKPQQGSINVLFVTVDEKPQLCLTPSVADLTISNDAAPTPESTSQAMMSPDTTGHVAPPTPAPSDGVEADIDTHLVDLSDETYAVILNSKLSLNELACGLMVKRGVVEDDNCLPSLGVNAIWVVRLKHGESDAEITSRHVELMLKEVMSSFRNLAVLAKVRGLQRAGEEMLPIHVLGSKRSADALTKILDSSSE